MATSMSEPKCTVVMWTFHLSPFVLLTRVLLSAGCFIT